MVNLASVALVLPGCALAVGFFAVQSLARHTLGEWLEALWAALDWLPPPEQVSLWLIAVVGAFVALLYAVVRLPWLLPILVITCGGISVAYMSWVVGPVDIRSDPIVWMSLIGIGIGIWQLDRCRGMVAGSSGYR